MTDQVATLARDETLKTYTLTYSPKTDSTLTALVCDTTAYDLSALVGQVRFSGKLREVAEGIPKPFARRKAYYSLELQGLPTRQALILQQQKLIGKWQLVAIVGGLDLSAGPEAPRLPDVLVENGPHVQFNNNLTYSSSWRYLACTRNGKISGNGNFSFSKSKEKLPLLNITYVIEGCDGSQNEYSIDKLFYYGFEEGYLILSNSACVEGCSYKFQKLKE